MDKVRENRDRRVLKRRGLILVKIRRRDPDALDFGKYNVLDHNGCMAAGGEPWEALTLDEVEAWMGKRRPTASRRSSRPTASTCGTRLGRRA